MPNTIFHGPTYQSSTPVTETDEEEDAKIDYALICFQFFSIYIVVSLTFIFVWDIYLVGRSLVLSKDIFDTLLQMYNPVIAFIAIFIEAELTDTIRSIDLLQSWTLRVLTYIFIGLLTKVQCKYSSWSISRTCLFLNNTVSGNLMILGVIYTCLGLLQVRKIKDEKMATYIRLLSLHEMQQIMQEQQLHSRNYR
jgi:hypothetical protein